MMLSGCEVDTEGYKRSMRRYEIEQEARREAERIAADPYLSGLQEVLAAEERFRQGDPKWYVPRFPWATP